MKTKRMANQVYQLTCSYQEIVVLRVLLDMAIKDYEVSGPQASGHLLQIKGMAEKLGRLRDPA